MIMSEDIKFHNEMAISVENNCKQHTVGVPGDILLNLCLSQRSPWANIQITVPEEIAFEPESVLVNVIGRGEVTLENFAGQPAGRCGIGHERTVGEGAIEKNEEGSTTLFLRFLDLRPDNGIDVQVRIPDAVFLKEGMSAIQVWGVVLHEEKTVHIENQTILKAVTTISDFKREISVSQIYDVNTDYRSAVFSWTSVVDAKVGANASAGTYTTHETDPAKDGGGEIALLHSMDGGLSWEEYAEYDEKSEGRFTRNKDFLIEKRKIRVHNLKPDTEHWFKLAVDGDESNIAKVYSGMYNVRTRGNAPTDGQNAAGQINEAIAYINGLGGGTVLFEGGIFSTTTIYLKSNVYLYIDKTASIQALPGLDDEEQVWYSDEEFRNDQSHMSKGPYVSPDNWMTKQDAGHSYFRNALFFGQRLDNVKIIGNGRLEGNGNLTKSNTVMDNESGYRADKMISLKLCSNVEIGGLSIEKDLWYKETENPNEDVPFYLDEEGNDSGCGIDNMLRVLDGGHFVVLATGVDGISTHDVYAEKGPQVRDIFDYMGCNDILAFNIYVEGSSDDIIKLGSDCALGFTRTSRNAIVRNVIGDTACNLFQIGSETADDIQDVCIDNIYVLASNKAGFSISVNDGGHIRNIHLNCGGSVGRCEYGLTHGKLSVGYNPAKVNPHKSIMRRIRTPFFISLSNRGRILGTEAVEKTFTDDIGVLREELLVKNVNIGKVENVFLKNMDIRDVYGVSQAKSETKSRWPEYQGQPRTTPLIVGYKIPDKADMTLPDGSRGRCIENVVLQDIDMTVKGGNPPEDAFNTPRELGVGQFNLRNLAEDDRGSKIPAYGYYVRHVKGMTIENCSIHYEEKDDRYAVVLSHVEDIKMNRLTVPESEGNKEKVKITAI